MKKLSYYLGIALEYGLEKRPILTGSIFTVIMNILFTLPAFLAAPDVEGESRLIYEERIAELESLNEKQALDIIKFKAEIDNKDLVIKVLEDSSKDKTKQTPWPF